MSAHAKPLHLRLFLEGIEVPVISASVTININSPAAASIQIVPVDPGMEFKPRTMVHLFFLDQYEVLPSPQQTKDDKLDAAFLQNYKLFFSGEIVGFTVAQSPQSRSLIIQCLDFSSYWDAAVAEAIDYGPQGNAFTHNAAFYGADAGLFDDIVNHQGERMMGWIRSPPLTPGLQTVSGLAGGVIRMLEAMGGVPNHHKGVNDFFTVAQLRCKLLEQITAEEHDNTAANLLSVKIFDEWLLNGLQNAGPQVTFRDMLKMLFNYIYYEVVPNPVAKYDPEAVTGPTQIKKVLVELAQNPKAIKAVFDLNQIADNCGRHAGGSGDNPDAAKINAKALVAELKTVKGLLQQVGSSAKPAIQHIEAASNALQRGVNAKTSVEVDKAYVDAQKPLVDAIDILETSDAGSTTGTQVRTGSTTDRLRTQIIRPDCFFSAPPVCNVIFPEQYTQLQYERTYISEVTRNQIMIYHILVGQDALLSDRIVAPNVGRDIKFVSQQQAADGVRALMPHELHTGIVGRSEWLPNTVVFSRAGIDQDTAQKQRGARLKWSSRVALFHFFKYRFANRQAALSGRFNPYLVAGFPAVVIRRPFIISPGEGAIAMKDLESDAVIDAVQNQAADIGGPTQLVGMIGGLQHTVDQTGGTTSVSMNHVRNHLGIDDEFVGVYSQVPKRKKTIRVLINAKKALADNNKDLLAKLVDVTPQTDNGKKAKVSKKGTSTAKVGTSKTKVSGSSTSTTFEDQTIQFGTEVPINFNSDGPLVVSGRIEGIDKAKVNIPNPAGKLTVGAKGVYGTIKGVEVLPPFSTVTINGKLAFTSVALYEEVEVEGTFDVPIEEIIRPTWFSDSYNNDHIGDRIYQRFFGCASIVDQVKFAIKGQQELPATVAGSNDTIDVTPDKPISEVVDTLAKQEAAKGYATIEKAINLIGYFYGLVKTKGLDVDRFIEAYSRRPVATLVDVLGTPDLEFGVDASGKASVTKGRAGFHSTAVHKTLVENTNRLAGLLDSPTQQYPRINNEGKKSSIPPEYDVRREKRERVLGYIQALQKARGLKG